MDVYVYVDAYNLVEKPLLMGVLSTTQVRGKEVFSFKADEGWLSHTCLAYLDADLQPYKDSQSVI